MFPLTRCRNCGSGLRIRPITFWATPGCQSQLPCQSQGEPSMARKGQANHKIDLQQCSVLVSSETAAAGAYAPNFSSPRMRHDQRFMRTLRVCSGVGRLLRPKQASLSQTRNRPWPGRSLQCRQPALERNLGGKDIFVLHILAEVKDKTSLSHTASLKTRASRYIKQSHTMED